LAAAAPCAWILFVACGGAKPNIPAHDTTQTTVSGGPRADVEAPGNPTTTTNLPADPGGGTKLSPSGEADAGSKAHVSDPGRSVKDIQAIVMARRDEARACYDKALATHPGIEGDVDVRWVIDPQGNVTEIDVDPSKSTIAEPSVGKCIIEIIKKVKFSKSERGFETRTHYPFNFHPKPGQGADAGAKK
jgi:TonB family protein